MDLSFLNMWKEEFMRLNKMTRRIVIISSILTAFFVYRAIVKDDYVMDLVKVQGDFFLMGSSDGNQDEMPIHKVKLNSFYISKYEITNKQYCQFLNEFGNQNEEGVQWLETTSKYCKIKQKGKKFTPIVGYENHPVSGVTWYGSKAFCEWKGGRLPTEAEWEFAAKGGIYSRGYMFSGDTNVNQVAWYISTSGGDSQPIGTKKPNELGIYDMSGNAWEWVYDRYHEDYYQLSPEENPKGSPVGKNRVIRGGSWSSFGIDNLRSTGRVYANPQMSGNYSFRVVKEIEEN